MYNIYKNIFSSKVIECFFTFYIYCVVDNWGVSVKLFILAIIDLLDFGTLIVLWLKRSMIGFIVGLCCLDLLRKLHVRVVNLLSNFSHFRVWCANFELVWFGKLSIIFKHLFWILWSSFFILFVVTINGMQLYCSFDRISALYMVSRWFTLIRLLLLLRIRNTFTFLTSCFLISVKWKLNLSLGSK